MIIYLKKSNIKLIIMKKLFLLMIISAFLFSCGNNENKTKKEQTKQATQEIVKLNVDEFLAKASDYVGKKIELTGTVNHVCKHGAKRLKLMGTNPEELIKVESGDKIGKFDVSLEGSDVCVKGIVKELIINEDYIAQLESKVKNTENKEHADDHHDDLTKIQEMRDQIKASGTDYISIYYITDCNEYKVVK